MEDAYELKTYLLKLSDDDLNEMDESDVNELLWNKYDIDADCFDTLVNDLLPLCCIAKSDLTNTWYRGFGKDGLWLMKQQIK